MATAIVLTKEQATEHGLAGEGPFTFPGAFPGVFSVGQPIEVTELGFADEAEARDALTASGLDLSFVDVTAGSAPPQRRNHLDSGRDELRRKARKVIERKAGGKITTHAEADKVAAALGIAWPEDRELKLAEKVSAIEQVKAGHETVHFDAPQGEES